VVYVDGFGNCLTNIPAALAAQAGVGRGAAVTASWKDGHARMQVVGSYGDVPLGDPLVLLEAPSSLQLCVNRGSFAEKYGVSAGAIVAVVASDGS
jgi:S-adenosylmethionine hydrolase